MKSEEIAAVPGAEKLIPFIEGELQYFRKRLRPIFFISSYQSSNASFIKELLPRHGEFRIHAKHKSAFKQSDLQELLLLEGVERLTLTGLKTATHLLPTANDARTRGFEVSVPEPCAIDADFAVHERAMLELQQPLLNCLTYPKKRV